MASEMIDKQNADLARLGAAELDEDFASPWLPAQLPLSWQLESAEAHLLPFWHEECERQEHADTIVHFRTTLCPDFSRGHCPKHGNKGKGSQCFHWHFKSQCRRRPVNEMTGRLAYWDVPCQAWSDDPGLCAAGEHCSFAHGCYEVSYHPAKYKTRMCNGHECRGEDICCFAHGEAEHRHWAPDWYSYSAVASSIGIGGGYLSGSLDIAMAQQPEKGGSAQGASQKHRFCASFPNIAQCRRGTLCAFAHTREEVQTPLLSEAEEKHEAEALDDAFFTTKFKTLWCPIGAQHDWQTCSYAHTYQDVRRVPSIGYGPLPCPYWNKKDTRLSYLQRCPLGLRCPYSHGAKEQLYHPKYFRTVICRDLQLKGCPRQKLCAFFHRRGEKRTPSPDRNDYATPLGKDALPEDWVTYILAPPFFQETGETHTELVEPPARGRPQMYTPAPGWQDAAMWGPMGSMPYSQNGVCDEEEPLGTSRTQTTAGDSCEGAASSDSREGNQIWSTPGIPGGSASSLPFHGRGNNMGGFYYMGAGVPMGGWWGQSSSDPLGFNLIGNSLVNASDQVLGEESPDLDSDALQT
uniref:C3H1-type domain-containing protein n=1 Tax=Noctiluca scintillans TaxID=2966 RepID=A0A7S1AS45_NOCSC|mmetsp:Transcript_57919/g.154335  ORF Transcript_57919/g.154335 Transcript_57919/m.154335 type:complete len:576 (+) Transcript_57919:54-1781(+)